MSSKSSSSPFSVILSFLLKELLNTPLVAFYPNILLSLSPPLLNSPTVSVPSERNALNSNSFFTSSNEVIYLKY